MKKVKDVNKIEKVKNKIINYILIIITTFILATLACIIIFDPFMLFNENSNEIDKPVINYTDGQMLDLQNLNISWNDCYNANYYMYKVSILTGQPTNDINENVSIISENIDGTKERIVNVLSDKLQEGKWVKIAIAACNDKNQVWSSTYLYINLSGNINNTQVNIKYSSNIPVIDGILNTNEYGAMIHSVNYTNDEFIDFYDSDHSIKSDFYMTWDYEKIYFAWVVNTDNHSPVADYNNDGNIGTSDDLKYMWKFSSIQFMLSTGAPDVTNPIFQTSPWSGNYLETGLSIMANGTSDKYLWSKPIDNKDLSIDDITFAGKRDEQNKTTTYEVGISWKKLGITEVNDNFKFGFSYAIGDQQNFDIAPNMVEWQHAILGRKNMDAGSIITLIK